jgi:hypothetical protein
LLVGDNAFIGVSHLSQARARDRLEHLAVGDMVSVIQKAISCGASGYVFSTHPTNYEILKSMKADEGPERSFGLYPIMPYAEGYVRVVNEKGMLGLVMEIMSRLPLPTKTKFLIQGGISAVTFDPVKMLRAYVDMELASYLQVKPDNAKIQAVVLHEVFTDLAVSFELKDLLTSFTEHVHDKYGVKPGFVTRNFAKFVDFLQDAGISWKDLTVMTPFNKIGFQMNPSREACEAKLPKLSNGEVIAMSILAAGYLQLNEAIEYVNSLPNLTGVTVGVSSQEHAEETFTILSRT